MEFRKFEKIKRLGTQETDGILSGTVWVAAKLDGTNGSVWNVAGRLGAGSRNRNLVATGPDNAGFRAAMAADSYITEFRKANPTLRLYGEWLVPHTIKGYLDDAWRKFYVYDVWDELNEFYLSPAEWMPMMEAAGLNFIRHHQLIDPDMRAIEAMLEACSEAYMKEGEIGEGIVVKNFGFTNRYGECVYGKVINTKEMNQPKMKSLENTVETDIAEACVTPELVHKTANKIIVAQTEGPIDFTKDSIYYWDRKTMIPRLMETVYHDVITEKLWDQLKKLKQPTVNFKVLRGCVSRAIKDNGKEYF